MMRGGLPLWRQGGCRVPSPHGPLPCSTGRPSLRLRACSSNAVLLPAVPPCPMGPDQHSEPPAARSPCQVNDVEIDGGRVGKGHGVLVKR